MPGDRSSRFVRAQRAAAIGAQVLLLLALCWALAGCGSEQVVSIEPRQIGDKVTEADLQLFLDVIDRLPDKKLPALPTLYKLPPAWDDQRTLPVKELVREEAEQLEKFWTDDATLRLLVRNRALQKALNPRLPLDQFVSLIKGVGMALSRNTIRPEQDLEFLIERGERGLESLRNNSRQFNTLKAEEQHAVLTTAVWVTRIDRAKRLLQVPIANRELASVHYDRLKEIFPSEYTTNPFDAISDRVEELGLPFEELAQSGADAEIDWSESDAVRGDDQVDPEFRPRDGRTARTER